MSSRTSERSERDPGPITTSLSGCAKVIEQRLSNERHGVWVPAFAGTTSSWPSLARRRKHLIAERRPLGQLHDFRATAKACGYEYGSRSLRSLVRDDMNTTALWGFNSEKQPRQVRDGASNGLVVRDAWRCHAPHHEDLAGFYVSQRTSSRGGAKRRLEGCVTHASARDLTHTSAFPRRERPSCAEFSALKQDRAWGMPGADAPAASHARYKSIRA